MYSIIRIEALFEIIKKIIVDYYRLYNINI